MIGAKFGSKGTGEKRSRNTAESNPPTNIPIISLVLEALAPEVDVVAAVDPALPLVLDELEQQEQLDPRLAVEDEVLAPIPVPDGFFWTNVGLEPAPTHVLRVQR